MRYIHVLDAVHVPRVLSSGFDDSFQGLLFDYCELPGYERYHAWVCGFSSVRRWCHAVCMVSVCTDMIELQGLTMGHLFPVAIGSAVQA